MKIFYFNGSIRLKSISRLISLELIKKIQSKCQNIQEVYIIDRKTNIQNCTGCRHCFMGNRCPLNKIDQFNDHVRELLTSDVVIFSTPVYLDNVSGRIKTFLDRMAYLTHYMPLAGKVGVAISVADTTGMDIASNYLKMVETNLGLKVVSTLGIKSNYFYSKAETIDEVINRIAEQVVEEMFNDMKGNDELEALYTNMKVLMSDKDQKKFQIEEKYWNSEKVKQCKDFESYCKLTKNVDDFLR